MVVVSKTFTTAETMLNARTMKDWLITSIKGKTAEEITRQHIVSPRATPGSYDTFFCFWWSSCMRPH